MKAARIGKYGDASVVKIEEIEKPVAGPGQVVVEVYAASLNPFDSKVRSGVMKDMIPLTLPITLGGDIAGVITEVGGEVETLQVGDKVYGQANAVSGNSGAFAEYAATSANEVARLPEGLDFTEAAAVTLVGVSALQALTEHINLQPGQKIFIHGGAGGIGTVAIQIAKYLGAYVATTATGEGVAYVRQLGTDEVIDYKTQDFAEILKNYDAVFDAVGGDDFTKSLRVLKQGGVAVSMIAQADEGVAEKRGITTLTQGTKVTTKRLDVLRELVECGAVTAHIDKVFTLDQIQEAFNVRENGTVRGKVVIKVKEV